MTGSGIVAHWLDNDGDPVAPVAVARCPRVLWANMACLLDTTSGASISAREMLRQLAFRGHEVAVVGATIFDNPAGMTRIGDQWDAIRARCGQFVHVEDGPLEHRLLVTARTSRDAVTPREEDHWYVYYNTLLDTFKPDLVVFYGDRLLDMAVAAEARCRGVPSVAYVVNGDYSGNRWCRDVDLILTDSEVTAQLYRDRARYRMTPVGIFVDPASVVATSHRRENLLLVNPSPEKGANIVILMALALEKRRPDIRFEVVQSRGDWDALVRTVTHALGCPRDRLDNVDVTWNTDDMRPVYGRARLLLTPSLWCDGGPRVLAEAMLNGIPAIVTDRGGLPEMIGDAGIVLKLPPECYCEPYMTFPDLAALEPLFEAIIRLFDDEDLYKVLSQRAQMIANERYSIEESYRRLLKSINPLLDIIAGDEDYYGKLTEFHKQKLPPDAIFIS